MNSTKHRALGLAILALAVVFIAVICVYLSVSSQCYSNEYWWITRLAENEGIAQIIGLGLAIVIAIPTGILLMLVSLSGKTTIIGARLIAYLILILLGLGLANTALALNDTQAKLDKAKAYAPGAYFGNEAFVQETLASIQEADDDSTWLLYIGRSDCSDCKDFESAWSKAYSKGKTDYSLAVYDTTLDRNGSQAGEMKAVLDAWGVASVPSVIELKGNTVVKIWDKPSESIADIKSAAQSCKERTNYVSAD